MSRAIRILKSLWNNPKKTVFFSCLVTGAVKYGSDKYQESQMMRVYCEEALRYGEVSQPIWEKERHVTVILNPAARDGKCFAKYEKYCAPLLHLAGLKVALVKTEREGQARDLMEVMENTSAVIVAGGDGTLAEIVTGLLRRADHNKISHILPLGVLPLGQKNSSMSAIWGFSGTPQAKDLAEATMAVVRNVLRPLDVMEVLPLNETVEGNVPKPVFAVSGMEWGAFRDANERKHVYWYWAFLKKYVTYIFSSYKDITWDCSSNIEFSLPCTGCSKCQIRKNMSDDNSNASQWRLNFALSWFGSFLKNHLGFQKPTENATKVIDYSKIINENCGVIETMKLGKVSDVSVVTRNTTESSELPTNALAFRRGNTDITTLDFIREGWTREWTGKRAYGEEILFGEMTLRPSEIMKTTDSKDKEMSIDGETYEVRPMRIRVRPNAVNIFGPLVK